MTRYLIRRLIQGVFLLFLMSIVFFLLLHAIPGGPEAVYFSPRMSGATRAHLAALLGLDRPLYVQYLAWLWNALHGNFGFSFSDGQPVMQEISQVLPNSLQLFAVAMPLALIAALLLGVTAAVRQYSITDYSTTVLAYFGIAMPVFWFALMVQYIFGVALHNALPIYGIQSPDTTGFSTFDLIVDRFLHLILPGFVLALLFIATWSRYLRSSMLDVVKQDYIRTAKAKGLAGRSVFFRHALRNALIPLVTQVAIDVGAIFGGAVITETVFAIPGVGKFFYDSLTARDYPILLALLLISSAAVILCNILADVLYAVFDPRIRYS